ncbi:sugar phosphate isomerase/epimerase [Kineosporia sp. J2-2]|uniref:Sugar phosphate isomerase/epimerase n=1 Tax=Kineosporia corallincola TaxID=2835133 RepID=A0ABS5TRW7_9ACTN|nr:sugar phosphate isomerase/epimerase family protein [Kineosporia corallincola]MBT0773530.1 sugar phosphate isomerase/epimerase [Kineosporia corallincola]
MNRSVGASTLGAPHDPLDRVLALMARNGATHLELRLDPDAPPPEPARLHDLLDRHRVRLLALTTGVRVGEPPEPAVLDRHLELAAALGAPFVRVFPGLPAHPAPPDQVPPPSGDRVAAERDAARFLGRAARVAADLGVRVALETHDSHPRGADLRRLTDRALEVPGAGPGVAVIWDLLHPWRVGETPAGTWAALGDLLRAGHGYVQIKDVASRRDTTPVLQGDGVVPVAEAVRLLDAGGYRGPISLEWERLWYPRVPPLEQALPAAVRALRALPAPPEP